MLTPVPPTECMRARESASARLDGELPELEAARLDAHLQECWECRAWAEDIQLTTGRLRGAELERPSIAVELPSRTALHVRRALVLSGTAAALAVAVIVGLHSSPQPSQHAAASPNVSVIHRPFQQDVRDAHILALSRKLTRVDLRNGVMFAA